MIAQVVFFVLLAAWVAAHALLLLGARDRGAGSAYAGSSRFGADD